MMFATSRVSILCILQCWYCELPAGSVEVIIYSQLLSELVLSNIKCITTTQCASC